MPGDPLKDWLTRRGWLRPGGLLSRPIGALLLTMACAALLLSLGYEAAQHSLGSQLEAARTQLAEQTTRANRLAQENQALEARLVQFQAQLDARSGLGQDPPDGSRSGPGALSRVLHPGETLTLLDGRLSLTLQAVLSSPRRALLRLKTPNAPETETALRPSQDLTFRLGRQSWRLSLHQLQASSAAVSLQSVGE